ncbi:cell division protein FtsQ/DivIB [Lacibacterium aquatile]|uniref:Cell division protein FtsQ n=1 Tax=Lacibacterium aquatile TaxID=1168082 RepID=A0ABW5DR19_9PROT
MGMNDDLKNDGIKLVGMIDLRIEADERPSLPSFLTQGRKGAASAPVAAAPAKPAGRRNIFKRKKPERQQAAFEFSEPTLGTVAAPRAEPAPVVMPVALVEEERDIPVDLSTPLASVAPVALTQVEPDAAALRVVIEPERPRIAPIEPVREETVFDAEDRPEPTLAAAPAMPRLIMPNAPVTTPTKRSQLPVPVRVPRQPGKALVPTGRRKKPAGPWLKRVAYGLSGLALLVTAGAGALVVQRYAEAPVVLVDGEEEPSVIRLALARIMGEAGLKIGDVLVEGRNRVPTAAVLNALHVERGEPILSYDAEAARQRLEALPWVATAMVERRLPDILYVRLTERQPFALWQQSGKFHLVDAKGAVIATDDIASWSHLPLVVGDGAPKAAEEFLMMLAAEPEIAGRVKAAVRVGDRRWNLTLDGDIEVRLPEENPAVALGALADMNRQGKLLEKDIRAVDLRIPDRMVVRMSPPAAERLRIVPAVNGQKNG